MKTAFAIFFGFMAFPALPGGVQGIVSQNKPAPIRSLTAPTFQIDGPGIRRPGRYQIQGKATLPLWNALYLAGGFRGLAKEHEVCVMRPKQNKMVALKVDATDQQKLLTFQVQAGDRLIVPAYSPIGDGDIIPPFFGIFRH